MHDAQVVIMWAKREGGLSMLHIINPPVHGTCRSNKHVQQSACKQGHPRSTVRYTAAAERAGVKLT
jgi:hypothetical protein